MKHAPCMADLAAPSPLAISDGLCANATFEVLAEIAGAVSGCRQPSTFWRDLRVLDRVSGIYDEYEILFADRGVLEKLQYHALRR